MAAGAKAKPAAAPPTRLRKRRRDVACEVTASRASHKRHMLVLLGKRWKRSRVYLIAGAPKQSAKSLLRRAPQFSPVPKRLDGVERHDKPLGAALEPHQDLEAIVLHVQSLEFILQDDGH